MKKSLLFLSALGVLLTAGCTSGPYTPKHDPSLPEVSGRPVVLLDKDLVRTLAVDKNPRFSRTSARNLRIQAGLRNRRNDETLQIQVQTLFFDKYGQVLYSEVGSESAWETIVLAPNQMTYYTQSSLTPAAVRYTVRIRYLNHPTD